MKTISRKLVAAMAFPAIALAGCYVVPVGHDGRPVWPALDSAPVPTSMPVAPVTVPGAPPAPAVLQVRLYPANEIATQTGVLNGTVANMMNGKGRFNLNFKGEVLSGEATRTSSDARKGVASALGTGGSFMSCEYQMSSPYQGAGDCSFSNGARYQFHVGN